MRKTESEIPNEYAAEPVRPIDYCLQCGAQIDAGEAFCKACECAQDAELAYDWAVEPR